ncbi:hypothetical protein BCR44DRAFT_95178 [Catenaria anguillulae PL171]|uniref:Oxysterol-binding protein n=1 Tax=Catenaria anguillulae PL171 TaxID=765915 RepID=A0A1Y2H710_9FUNG|nr:hypothetical protein BCR44DRAFT_95178 [Catenaria anguillulae PL171]
MSTPKLNDTSAAADSPVDPDAANVVPASHRSQFTQFLKTLTSFTGDLSQLTCPAFLLSGVSLLEYSAHWADHPDLFYAIAAHTDPVDRMVAVARWFISTLYGSFHSRCKTGTEKKPFNPVLGEQFYCWWPADDKEGVPETRMVCEQVSHHPPVGAFAIENDKKNIFLNGHCGQKTKFKTTYIKVEQTGRAVVTVFPPDGSVDEYFVTLPEMALRGLLSGQLFVELLGKSSITSASGYQTVFEYVPKGWFTGEYHSIKGTISKLDLPGGPLLAEAAATLIGTDASGEDAGGSPTSTTSASSASSTTSSKKASKKARKMAEATMQSAISEGEVLFEVSGKWTTTCVATRLEDGAEEILFDADEHEMQVPQVKPLEHQTDLESRKLWHKVATALNAQDYQQATAIKTTIEDEQRALRKARVERGESWAPKNFVFVSDGASAASKSSETGGGSDAGSMHSLASSKMDLAGPGLQARAALRGLSVIAVGGSGGTEALVDEGLWTFVPERPASSMS